MLIPVSYKFIMRNASPHLRIFLSYSLYPYGDSPCAYGDQYLMCLRRVSDLCLGHALNKIFLDASAHPPTSKNNIHTGIDLNPRMHTGIACHVIPVCIWGSIKSPYTYGDQDQSPYAYGDYMTCNPRMHMGIKINPRMHTGIDQIPICIRGSRTIPVCIQGLLVM
jgi:hypothetical protein